MDMITGRVEETISVQKKIQKIWRDFEKNPLFAKLWTQISRDIRYVWRCGFEEMEG